MITSIRYENGDRSAVVCRTIAGDRWEVHLLRWDAHRRLNTRTRRFAPRMVKAQAIARIWCARAKGTR